MSIKIFFGVRRLDDAFALGHRQGDACQSGVKPPHSKKDFYAHFFEVSLMRMPAYPVPFFLLCL